ncbi:uncharacterized protein LOC129587812 isoform X2 [Paramacrobiotus metropolitanus]|nr:uncharacterized protein LOC129587812 isoform X2 [Paramacrobiotus metropolitanus]
MYVHFTNQSTFLRKPTPDRYGDDASAFLMIRNITKILNEDSIAALQRIEQEALANPKKRIVVIQGYTMWYSYWNRNNSVSQFVKDLHAGLPHIKRIASLVCYAWMPQPPLNTDKDLKWVTALLDHQMQQINQIAQKSLEETSAVYWSKSMDVAASDLKNYYDFAHPDLEILLRDWHDLLLSFGCRFG